MDIVTRIGLGFMLVGVAQLLAAIGIQLEGPKPRGMIAIGYMFVLVGFVLLVSGG